MEREISSADIVIIGCGPAGAAAGKAAAENGAKVVILEQKREIGIPVYEAAASIYCLSELEEIAGVSFNRERVVASPLYGIAYIPMSGQADRYDTWTDGAVVRRAELERELAIAAANAGARILMGSKFTDIIRDSDGNITGVTFERQGKTCQISCRAVIGCDGALTDVGRRSGIDLPYSITVGYGIEYAGVKRIADIPKPIYESYMVPDLPGVTCWVVPRGTNMFSVGVGSHLSQPSEKKPLTEYFNAFLSYLEESGRFDFSGSAELQLIGGVTTGVVDVEKLTANGVILTGDAARRPLFGSSHGGTGMPSAVFTGKCAGQVMADAVKTGTLDRDSLQKAYRGKMDASFHHANADRASIAEAKKLQGKLTTASAEVKNAAIQAVGVEYSQLHLYLRGGLNYAGCVGKIRSFWDSISDTGNH